MAFLHGFRVFTFVRCSRTKEIALAGQAGMHLHSSMQKPAECRGISGAMWMTETARDRLANRDKKRGPRVPHETPSPDYDCSCGSYFFRTFQDAWISEVNAYAHVTCLGRTMLHQNGGRTEKYTVDYLIAPEREGAKVYVYGLDPKHLPPAYAPVVYGGWGMWGAAEERDQREVLEEVGLSLGVPVLAREDLSGCPMCLTVNGWREPEEITDKMKKDWFGEGYKR